MRISHQKWFFPLVSFTHEKLHGVRSHVKVSFWRDEAAINSTMTAYCKSLRFVMQFNFLFKPLGYFWCCCGLFEKHLYIAFLMRRRNSRVIQIWEQKNNKFQILNSSPSEQNLFIRFQGNCIQLSGLDQSQNNHQTLVNSLNNSITLMHRTSNNTLAESTHQNTIRTGREGDWLMSTIEHCLTLYS